MKTITAGRIKKLRKRMKLGQERFASIVGVSLNTVFRWEKGKVDPSPMAERQLMILWDKYYPEEKIGLGAYLSARPPEETAL
jgi:putative transcriptional regulator